VFETSPNAVPRPTTGVVTGSTLAWTPITLSNVGIFGQPRAPFKPLIDAGATTIPGETTTTIPGETTTTIPGETTTTIPGETTTTVPGETTTTVPGETTTTVPGETTTSTTGPDTPSSTRVALLEVREQGGVLVAVLTVDGETYTVGVGETFGPNGQFKVVSLTETGGVFTYGDNAFSLAVGQAVLK